MIDFASGTPVILNTPLYPSLETPTTCNASPILLFIEVTDTIPRVVPPETVIVFPIE